MNLPATLEELFEKRMNKKHRYWAKRTVRMLEKDFPGGVRYTSFSTPKEVERLFTDVLCVARKTYQWGLGVGFQGSEENRQRLMLEARNGWFRGYVVYVKEEPVAFWICTVYKGTGYLDYTGYDPDFGKYEVGTALLFRVIDEMCKENIKQLDFGVGSAFYKERLADSSFEEGTMCAFAFSLRGVLLNALKLLTQFPVELMRNLLLRLGLEQKVKKLWRSYVTPDREPDRLVKTSVQVETTRAN
jgi:CelD/BcsL family acetyltransferase involved in cellulose biosynthesis